MFLIRTIDFTAAGREIIRDRMVEQTSLTIGRAAENDIHLADLAVEQRHVRIDARPDGSLAVAALGTLGFALDGRTVTEGKIDPATGGEIALGTARLAIAREGENAIAITIRQVAAEEGKADALRGFSLASVLPSKRAMSWSFAAAILIALLMVPVASHLARTPVKNDPDSDAPGQVVMDAAWSTGALSLKHHKLQDNCESCHVTPFVSVQDATCISCHEEIGDHARPPRLAAGMPLSAGDALQWRIAQGLGKEGPLGCVACHTEHEGPLRQKPAAQAFCADCHDALDTRLTDTDLADAHDFGKEHPQFRPAYYASFGAAKPVRAALDSKPVERSGLKFPHDVHMDAKGGAARMALSLPQYGAPLECKDCHSLTADKIAFKEVKMEDACEGCHSLVAGRTAAGGFSKLRHGDVKDLAEDLARIGTGPRATPASNRSRPGRFARGGGVYAADFGRPVRSYIGLSNALSPGGICTECHLPTRKAGRPDLMPVNLPDRFLTTGFFSHEAHRKEECTDCHAADTSRAASDLLIPDLKSCRDCHLGASAVKTKKIVPSSCAMCHSYHVPAGQWSPEDKGREPHYRPSPGPAKATVAAVLAKARP